MLSDNSSSSSDPVYCYIWFTSSGEAVLSRTLDSESFSEDSCETLRLGSKIVIPVLPYPVQGTEPVGEAEADVSLRRRLFLPEAGWRAAVVARQRSIVP